MSILWAMMKINGGGWWSVPEVKGRKRMFFRLTWRTCWGVWEVEVERNFSIRARQSWKSDGLSCTFYAQNSRPFHGIMGRLRWTARLSILGFICTRVYIAYKLYGVEQFSTVSPVPMNQSCQKLWFFIRDESDFSSHFSEKFSSSVCRLAIQSVFSVAREMSDRPWRR